MRKISFVLFFVFLFISLFQLKAQERAILVPKPITGSPFQVDDSDDLFGTAYRWFLEGEYELGLDSLKKLIKASGFQILPGNYYVVMANFTDSFSPIGLIHEDDDFFSTRMYGLKENNLYYIYISRQREGKSFLSVLVTAKDSPFMENLPLFIGIFQPLVSVDAQVLSGETTWIDIRQFNVPVPFRKFSDLSFIIKPSLSEEKILAKTVFDNTSKERWSYGIASAITNAKDVDIIVGADGKITVRPKPNLDLAAFAVINYHFIPVDTKAPTLASSFHLLGGIRMIDFVEPIIGIGGGINMGMIDLHLFAGFSMEIANKLKEGYEIGQVITKEVDPFESRFRGKFRFGIEVKFP
jgi:hypothetical protein